MSRDLNRLGSVFRAHDEKHFTLPAPVLEARSVYGRLVSAESPVPAPDLGHADMALIADLLDQASKDAPVWPGPEDVIAARAANEASEAWAAARLAAMETAEERLVSSIMGRADVIIRECLGPAIEQCLADARKVSKNFEAVRDFDDRQLLAAEPKPGCTELSVCSAGRRARMPLRGSRIGLV